MTRFLLDSHVLIWWRANPDSLTPEAGQAIASGHSHLFFSHASIWELHIKISKDRLTLPEPIELAAKHMRCHLLPIELAHLDEVKHLPHHHGDPFDRMLIAQARVNDLTLVTRDRDIQRYDVQTLAA